MLRPFFRHFGGKWNLASHLPEPRYRTIVEPFAGGAGYSLRYGEGRDVVLRDIDPDTVSIWQWLQQATRSDIEALHWNLGDIEDVFALDCPRPAQLLIQRWLTTQGSRSNKRPPPAALRAGCPGSYWGAEVRARLVAQCPLIRHWDIALGGYDSCPDILATWEVDPPYQGNRGANTRSTYGAGRSRGVDFAALAQWCVGRRGEVIVHEQAGATWLPFATWRDATTGRADNGVRKTQQEVIYYQRRLWGRW